MSNTCAVNLVRLLAAGIAAVGFLTALSSLDNGRSQADDVQVTTETDSLTPASLSEARGRARLLHEAIGGALQVMHRDFFDDENPPAIPSSSLEDVFAELARNHRVELKWLTVETDVLNVDHKPADDFEVQAVAALAQGQSEFESSGTGTYRYAGAIRLVSQCLKCHVKQRTSLEPRTAGLVIRMPFQSDPPQNAPRTPANDRKDSE